MTVVNACSMFYIELNVRYYMSCVPLLRRVCVASAEVAWTGMRWRMNHTKAWVAVCFLWFVYLLDFNGQDTMSHETREYIHSCMLQLCKRAACALIYCGDSG